MEGVEAPSLKEVHIVVGRRAFSFKMVERRWYTTPKLLLTYACSLLRHARGAHLVLVAPRLTSGAARLAAGLRWVRIIPYRVASPRALAYWLLTRLLEALREAIAWRRERGLPAKWLRELAREAGKAVRELGRR